MKNIETVVFYFNQLMGIGESGNTDKGEKLDQTF